MIIVGFLAAAAPSSRARFAADMARGLCAVQVRAAHSGGSGGGAVVHCSCIVRDAASYVQGFEDYCTPAKLQAQGV